METEVKDLYESADEYMRSDSMFPVSDYCEETQQRRSGILDRYDDIARRLTGGLGSHSCGSRMLCVGREIYELLCDLECCKLPLPEEVRKIRRIIRKQLCWLGSSISLPVLLSGFDADLSKSSRDRLRTLLPWNTVLHAIHVVGLLNLQEVSH